MKPRSRKLLPDADTLGTTTALLPSPYSTTSSDPLLHHATNATAESRPFLRPNSSPMDSSMALTALVLLTALFFMGFFSLYLRRFADSPSSSSSSRPRRRPSSPFSSSLPLRRPSNAKGLDPAAVRSLPLVSYGGYTKHPIVDCVICLCEFEEGEKVKMIPYCRHVFHPDCVDTWLASHVSCPLCRSEMIFGGGEARRGVVRGKEVDCGGDGSLGRSTVEIEDVGRSTAEIEVVGAEVGPVGMMRRACSWPSVGDGVVLERSLSF